MKTERKSLMTSSPDPEPPSWMHKRTASLAAEINNLLQCLAKNAHFPYKLAIFQWGFWAIIALLFPWTPGSKQCEIRGFQKGITCPCASRGCKVAGCQTFFILQKLHFSFYISYCHMKTVPPMNTWFFQVLKLWQPVTLQPLLHMDKQYLFGSL